jgi:nucleotide-binding universal stress UspA family protein
MTPARKAQPVLPETGVLSGDSTNFGFRDHEARAGFTSAVVSERRRARKRSQQSEHLGLRIAFGILRPKPQEAVMPFRNLLVPIDFDETSEHALDRALSLAHVLGANVTVLHVYGLPIYNYPDGSYVPSPEVAESVKSSAREQLHAFIAKKSSAGAALTPLLREGRTAQEICKAATEIGADLIVMGTHGRGLLGRTILGSVAEAVLRQASVPVMTIRGA